MYQNYYHKHLIKSACIIVFLFLFAITSTYIIYHKFAIQRNQDYDSGQMEVIFHDKNGNEVNLTQFTPVTDAVGLASPSYTFTVTNNTNQEIHYKIVLVENKEKELACGCSERKIPQELLKISFRKDHSAPNSYVLDEIKNNIIQEDVLQPNTKEDYSLRIWAMNSNFIVDKTSHYHASIQVVEE